MAWHCHSEPQQTTWQGTYHTHSLLSRGVSLRPIDAYYLGCDDGGTEHLHQLNQTHLTLFPRHTHTHTPEFIKSMNYKCGEHMCSPCAPCEWAQHSICFTFHFITASLWNWRQDIFILTYEEKKTICVCLWHVLSLSLCLYLSLFHHSIFTRSSFLLNY